MSCAPELRGLLRGMLLPAVLSAGSDGGGQRKDHLRRLLHEYVNYYNAERVHTSIGDAPAGRPLEHRPSSEAAVVALPRVGGLHLRYGWRDAA